MTPIARRPCGAFCASVVGLLAAGAAVADDIVIRISVKYICDEDDNPPPGGWTEQSQWDEAIRIANDGMARLRRGFRFTWQFDGNVYGSPYWIHTDAERCQFETDIRANPGQYHFRDDAVNVYIPFRTHGTEADPQCRGWASLPSDPCGGEAFTAGVVMMCSEAGPIFGMTHEFGHFFGLYHTFEGDFVDDTPLDADPNVCSPDNPATPANENCNVTFGGVECCCATKFQRTADRAAAQGWSSATHQMMRDNVMSYHCDNADDWTLSSGQMDRFTDIARRYRSAACTGVTYFVDWRNTDTPASFSGYSDHPYRTVAQGVSAAMFPQRGDIVMIRAGHYPENITINRRVTLRATGGVVRIGSD